MIRSVLSEAEGIVELPEAHLRELANKLRHAGAGAGQHREAPEVDRIERLARQALYGATDGARQ